MIRRIITLNLFAFLLVPLVSAEVTQTVRLLKTNPDGSTQDYADDTVTAATGIPISRPTFASLAGSGYESSAAIGVFGAVGVDGFNIFPGELSNQVVVTSDEHRNLNGIPANATLNFIVDGGQVTLDWAPEAEFQFALTINAEIFDAFDSLVRNRHWQSGFELATDGLPGSGRIDTFIKSGEDIGATLDPTIGTVDIPFSLQTLDLGTVPTGGRLELSYFVDFYSTIPQFAEVHHWSYSDPLTASLDSTPRLTVDFDPIGTAIPEPSALGFAGFLVAAFLVAARRRPA